MQSWLTIEAEDAAKLAKAPLVGADAIVVDLAGVPDGQDAAATRNAVATWLKEFGEPDFCVKPFARWVQVKPMDMPLWREDLVAVMAGAPDGVVLPKVTGPDDIRRLAAELYEIEQGHRLKHNSTKIMPRIGETARAALTLAALIDDPQPRLTAFTWHAPSVARAVGARRMRNDAGHWTGVLAHVRAATLMLARTMGVIAVETPADAFGDHAAIFGHAQSARLDGFHGMFATGPRQIAAIAEAYALSDTERTDGEAELHAAKAAFMGEVPARTPNEPDGTPAATDDPGPAPKLRAIG
ncbi:MAG: aldolase/citrate lyase family protein [Pontixanthobacter sp.]